MPNLTDIYGGVLKDDSAELNVNEESIGQTISVGAPGAGSLITNFAVAKAGLYKATFIIQITGTAETQLFNLRYRVAGVNKISLPTVPGDVNFDVARVYIPTDGALIDTQVIAAATAGSFYTVTCILTPIEI